MPAVVRASRAREPLRSAGAAARARPIQATDFGCLRARQRAGGQNDKTERGEREPELAEQFGRAAWNVTLSSPASPGEQRGRRFDGANEDGFADV